MLLTASPAVDRLRTTIASANTNLAMAEGFLMGPPAENIMRLTVGLLEKATIPLHYAVQDPSLPYGIGAPARDGYQVLMRARDTLQGAIHGRIPLDDAQFSAYDDVRTGRLLLDTARTSPY